MATRVDVVSHALTVASAAKRAGERSGELDEAPTARRFAHPSDLAALEHDIRTRLSAVRAAAEILREYGDLSSDERAMFAHVTVAEIERLTHGVEALLAELAGDASAAADARRRLPE